MVGQGGAGRYVRQASTNQLCRAASTLAAVVCLSVPAAASGGGLGGSSGIAGSPSSRMHKQPPEIVEVTATGEGITKEQARRDALRNALEQGGELEISSHSKVDNYTLIRDTIYSRADGIISDYKILSEGEGVGGVFQCEIRAKVSQSAIASTWGEVQNVIDQIGRPGIAVLILERIDGVIQDSSILESQIEHRLLEAGFDVYGRQHLTDLGGKEYEDAVSEVNVAKMQAIVKDFDTQIFITGTAQANAAGVRELTGQPTAMYNCDAAIKMYYTDTGQLCASESLPNTRGGARGHFTTSPQAGKKALENAGQDLVERCYRSVMQRWATRISAGGLIVLTVEGMKIADALKLKRRIKEIDPDKIMRVDGPKMTKGIVTFRIQAKMTATDLAVYLVEEPWTSLFEIVDLKTNRIQAKGIGR